MPNLRLYVDPPGFTNTPYNIFSAAEIRDSSDQHWMAGITYEPLCGGAATTFDPCIVSGTGSGAGVKTGNTTRITRGATAFTVYSEVDCAPVGHWDDAQNFAQQALLNEESYQVERAFWTGNAAGKPVVHPHLASNTILYDPDTPGRPNSIILDLAATVVTGSAVDPVEGLGMIEKALGDAYNGVGVIHIPMNVIPHFSAMHLMPEGQTRLRTWNGNRVVAGAGYPGTGPDGSDPGPGKAWIYATGTIFGYRSSIRTYASPNQSIDRSVNTQKMIAERTYVLAWDCALIAVLVSTGGETVGSALSAG